MATPAEYTTLFPYLFVDGAKDYIDFLIHGLGADELGRTIRDDRAIANCRLKFGNTTIMVSEAEKRYPPSRCSLYLYVDDAEASVRRAIEHGATLEMPLADMDYGDRQGGIMDPNGNIWWISQRL